jgi:hypothetical protein
MSRDVFSAAVDASNNRRCKESVLVPVLKWLERGALNRSVDFADCPSPRARD